MNMHRTGASWFIAIIVTIKSCVTYEILQKNNPSLVTSFITKPIKNLYEAGKVVPSLLRRVNPLGYLISPSTIFGKLNGGQPTYRPQHYTTKSDQLLINNNKVTPNIIQEDSTYFSNDKQKDNSQHFSPTIEFVTPHTFIKNLRTQEHDLELTTPTVITTTDVEVYEINNRATMLSTATGSETDRKDKDTYVQNIKTPLNEFMQELGQLESKFYHATFQKLLSISPSERRENGITFAQSGFFLYLQLVALCTESDAEIIKQINQTLGLKTSCEERVQLLKDVMSTLPTSGNFLKFRWTSRIVLGPSLSVNGNFLVNTAPALHVSLDHINKTDNPGEVTKRLNQMVEIDSGGAMHNTFDEDELSNGICAVWLTTMYVRARWRSAPTVLNGSRPFYDADAPPRTVRMIRINDVVRYAHLAEWDAEAIEIRYAVPDLTLLLLVPRGRSLKNLVKWISTENLQQLNEKMYWKRIGVTLPIYTLRMTLLLPGKLESMGISRLIRAKNDTNCDTLKLSHAVQRIMFWAEAGRNAFKDDGIEWDEAPGLERVLDHPYMFFVRWRNITLLNGNFVL